MAIDKIVVSVSDDQNVPLQSSDHWSLPRWFEVAIQKHPVAGKGWKYRQGRGPNGLQDNYIDIFLKKDFKFGSVNNVLSK